MTEEMKQEQDIESWIEEVVQKIRWLMRPTD